MILKVNEKCDCDEECEGKDYLIFKIKHFQVRLFNDYGHKFLYIHLGKKFKRWRW